MLEALVATAGLGLLLGLRYRVPAVLVASAAVAIAAIVVALFTAAPAWAVLIAPLCTVAALQGGYLGGLLLASRFRVGRCGTTKPTARRPSTV